MKWRDVFEIIADAVLKHGKCSRSFLQRKLKCTNEQAETYLEHYEEDQFLRKLQTICENMVRHT